MWKKILCLLCVALFVQWFYRIILMMGFHKTGYNHTPGPCKPLQNIEHGSEDMARIPGNKALITSGLKLFNRKQEAYKDRKARVFLFDFTRPDLGAQPVTVEGLTGKDEWDFMGISTWVDQATGDTTVFIVNHLEAESVVEIFSYREDQRQLVHLETAGKSDPTFRLLNDITAVGPRQFYATNFVYYRTIVEMLLLLKWSHVTFYDGKMGHVVTQERFMTPNGIAQSPDGKYIYLSTGMSMELVTFARNVDNTLTLKERKCLHSIVDNLDLDPETGDLWAGCHFRGYESSLYYDDPTQLSPSQVLRMHMVDGRVSEITEVLWDDGRLISGSSVAVYNKNKLLIGTVASNALLCDVKYI